MNEWIPVTKALPPPAEPRRPGHASDRVLATHAVHRSRIVLVMRYLHDTGEWIECDSLDIYSRQGITAWTELPKPWDGDA